MTSPSDPPVRRVWRAELPRDELRAVPMRQGVWTLTQAALMAGLHELAALDRGVLFGLALGLGALLPYLRTPGRAAMGVLTTVAATWFGDFIGLSPVLLGGFAAGLALAWVSGPSTWWRSLMLGLAVAAGSGLGLWAASVLTAYGASEGWAMGLSGALCGLVASNAGWVAALRWIAADRVPTPGTVRATLVEKHREPALRAWKIDQALASQAPDAETRDGLGEVAAWVYRLAWSGQTIERELAAIEGDGLVARVEAARTAAQSAEDTFTRERREAALRHLEQLVAHRDALALEAQRTAALQDYALAFLEQARGGLALSRLSPGEHVPERLTDVLGRLRSHAQDGDARRRTVRQLSSLA